MIPCRNVAVSATLAAILTFNLHTMGKGMMSITAPVTTFGMHIYRAHAISLIHVPSLCRVHWKMVMNVLAMAVAMVMQPMMQAVAVKIRLLVVKTRM